LDFVQGEDSVTVSGRISRPHGLLDQVGLL